MDEGGMDEGGMDAQVTTLSVRGEAQREVDPDVAELDVRVRTVAASKADALRAVGAQSRSLLAGLERLGGAVLTADERRDLGWVANGAVTWEEYEWREDKRLATGRVGAAVKIVVSVRAFGVIEAVSAVLDQHELAHLLGVGWAVDADNVAWAQVRAAAIAAAIAKGGDYAAALGGSLLRVEHVADAGLLGSRNGGWVQQESARAVAFKSVGDENDSPPLDPSPQRVSAVIEARFAASVAALEQRG